MKKGFAIKKPILVEFIELEDNFESITKVYRFINGEGSVKLIGRMAEDAWYDFTNNISHQGYMELSTLESSQGTQKAHIGDFILKGIDGECWPVKPDIFNRTYDIIK